jgi:hypothetical protein
MGDEQQTAGVDLRDVEAELCRLPDVVAARIVAEPNGRPVEVHVLAHTGKHPKQVVRDVQSVALASFGIDLDRRIVSVVQLGPNGDTASEAEPTAAPTRSRVRIVATEGHRAGRRATLHVTLGIDTDEATGFAEGSVASSVRPRLVAAATLDALRQLDDGADSLDIDSAQLTRVGADDVMVVTLVCVDPPHEERLSGSAILHQHADDAVVRAVLDATNRRLPFLSRRPGDA